MWVSYLFSSKAWLLLWDLEITKKTSYAYTARNNLSELLSRKKISRMFTLNITVINFLKMQLYFSFPLAQTRVWDFSLEENVTLSTPGLNISQALAVCLENAFQSFWPLYCGRKPMCQNLSLIYFDSLLGAASCFSRCLVCGVMPSYHAGA